MAFTYLIKRHTTYGQLIRKTSATAPVETFPQLAIGLGGYVVGQEVPAVKRPKGFMPPTRYHKYGQDDDRYAYRYGYAMDSNPSTGLYKYHIGCDTSNSVTCDLSSFDETVANKAIINARLNLKGQKVNFAQAFAERKQTANLVVSTAKRIASGLRSVRKGDLRGIAESLGLSKVNKSRKARKLAAKIRRNGNKPSTPSHESDVHNLWLSHKLGWLPLLNDVYGSAQLLAERDASDPKRYAQSVKASASSKTVTNTDTVGQAFGNNYGARHKKRTVINKKAFVRFDVYLENAGLSNLSAAGFTNPAALAWEVAPLSYVADWFIPIGSYLNALDAGVGWKFRAGSISKKMDGIAMARMEALKPPFEVLPKGQTRVVSGYGRATAFSLERLVYTSLPYPTSILPKNPFSASHVLTAIALVTQAALAGKFKKLL